MVTWLVGGRNAAVSAIGLSLCAAALVGGCGGGDGNSSIVCATQEHCTPHGLVCDEQRAMCVSGSTGGNGGGGQTNGGSGGNSSGGNMSSGGKGGSGGTVGGDDGTGGTAGSAAGSAGADGGSAGEAGTSGNGGVGGSAGDGGTSGTAGQGGSAGSAGAGGNGGTGGSAGKGGNGGAAGSAGTSGAGGAGGGVVGYHEDNSSFVDSNPNMFLEAINSGPAISSPYVVFRYYFSSEPPGNTWSVTIFYAGADNPFAPLTNYVFGTVSPNPSPTPGAERILEIAIDFPGSWVTGQRLQIQVNALPGVFDDLDQSNDYSYAPHMSLTEWDRITVSVDGTLVWGDPP